MFNAGKVRSWIPQRLKYLVDEVSEDSEVVELFLRDGFCTAGDSEVVWVFGKYRHESGDYTLMQIKSELIDWLDEVIKIDV